MSITLPDIIGLFSPPKWSRRWDEDLYNSVSGTQRLGHQATLNAPTCNCFPFLISYCRHKLLFRLLAAQRLFSVNWANGRGFVGVISNFSLVFDTFLWNYLHTALNMIGKRQIWIFFFTVCRLVHITQTIFFFRIRNDFTFYNQNWTVYLKIT